MIKFENAEVVGWEAAIRGMRNPMNSWDKSDSGNCFDFNCKCCNYTDDSRPICPLDNDGTGCDIPPDFIIGNNDMTLIKQLRKAGTPDHRKFMRMITVYVDITAPLYWWKEFDTYKVGTVANSCSTIHKIADKGFTLEDFSTEHLYSDELEFFKEIVDRLNGCRNLYLDSKKNESPRDVKNDWWQMIQLLPSSYNQRRTVMLNYEVLTNIYHARRSHKLDEWAEHNHENEIIGFCDWIKTLPYSELITEEFNNETIISKI